MDTKFLIIFILLGIIIFLIVKEFSSLKKQINNLNEKTKNLIYTSSSDIEQKMKSNLNSCVDKIKLINGDYMVQIRKMNELGKEQILTTNSNNYSESESEVMRKKNKIMYLSEGVESMQKKNQENNFQIKYSDKISEKKYDKVSEKKQDKISEKNYNKTDVSEINIDEEIKKINYTSSHDKSNDNSDDNSDEETNDENSDENSDETDEETNEETNDETNNNSDDETKGETKSEINNKSNDETNDDLNDLNDDLNDDGQILLDTETELNYNQNSATEKKQNSENKKTPLSSCENEFSSDKKNIINDNESVNTVDININNFHKIEHYSKKHLEKMAKFFGIPITCKDGDKRKALLKEELYEKIKEKIEDKIKK